MLKNRIIAVVVVRNDIVVQSIGFKKYLPIGQAEIALEFLTSWGVDEIIFLDISASKDNKEPNYDLIRAASKKCYVPLTVGGGITSIEHINKLMHSGADKISLNQACLKNIEFVSEASTAFGSQCIVASIDVLNTKDGYYVYDYVNKIITNIKPEVLAKQLIEAGVGEILINSVDRDGSYLGYDVPLIKLICDHVNVPVICCGGAKNASDFVKVFDQSQVSAAAAANLFHFTEHSVITVKSEVNRREPVRIETAASYEHAPFDENKRVSKLKDQILEEMLFEKIEKEII